MQGAKSGRGRAGVGRAWPGLPAIALALVLAALPAPGRAEAALGAWAAALGQADICTGTLRLEMLAEAAAQEAARAHPGLLVSVDGRRARGPCPRSAGGAQPHQQVAVIGAEGLGRAGGSGEPVKQLGAPALAKSQARHEPQNPPGGGALGGQLGIEPQDRVADHVEKPLLQIDRGGNGGGDVFFMERLEGQGGQQRPKGAQPVPAAGLGPVGRAADEGIGAEAIANQHLAARVPEAARIWPAPPRAGCIESFRKTGTDQTAPRW